MQAVDVTTSNLAAVAGAFLIDEVEDSVAVVTVEELHFGISLKPRSIASIMDSRHSYQ